MGWLTLLAPEATGDALPMASAGMGARHSLDAHHASVDYASNSMSTDAGSVSIDDIMAPDLDSNPDPNPNPDPDPNPYRNPNSNQAPDLDLLLVNLDLVSPIFQNS